MEKRLSGRVSPFLKYLGNEALPEAGKTALTLFALRECVVDALNLLVNVPDTPEIRHAMAVLFTKGANAFVKVAE